MVSDGTEGDKEWSGDAEVGELSDINLNWEIQNSAILLYLVILFIVVLPKTFVKWIKK